MNGPVTLNSGLAAGDRSVVSTNGFGNVWRTVNVTGGPALTSVNAPFRNPEHPDLDNPPAGNPGGVVRAQVAPAHTARPRGGGWAASL